MKAMISASVVAEVNTASLIDEVATASPAVLASISVGVVVFGATAFGVAASGITAGAVLATVDASGCRSIDSVTSTTGAGSSCLEGRSVLSRATESVPPRAAVVGLGRFLLADD